MGNNVESKLREAFPDRDLNYIIEEMNTRSRACPLEKDCICKDSTRLFETIKNLIESNDMLFRRMEVNVMDEEFSWVELEKVEGRDEKPIKEIFRGVTIQNVKDFFDRLNNDFIRASHQPDYDFPTHKMVCDCNKFFQKEFVHSSQSSYKRINYCLEHFADPKQAHGSVAVAIYLYFIENKLIEYPELQPSRARLNIPGALRDWPHRINTLIRKDYAQARKKEFKDIELVQSAEASRIWHEIFAGWRRDFPNFFNQDGKFIEKAIKYPDYGEMFNCTNCKLLHVKSTVVPCVNPKSRLDQPHHEFCRECVRKSASVPEFCVAINSSSAGIKCLAEECLNPIRAEDFLTLLEPDERQPIRMRILAGLVKDLGHVTKDAAAQNQSIHPSDSSRVIHL